MSNASPKMSNAYPTDSNQNLAQEQIDGGIASSQTLANGIQAIALRTATTRRNRLKTQSLLLRNFRAQSRSIR